MVIQISSPSEFSLFSTNSNFFKNKWLFSSRPPFYFHSLFTFQCFSVRVTFSSPDDVFHDEYTFSAAAFIPSSNSYTFCYCMELEPITAAVRREAGSPAYHRVNAHTQTIFHTYIHTYGPTAPLWRPNQSILPFLLLLFTPLNPTMEKGNMYYMSYGRTAWLQLGVIKKVWINDIEHRKIHCIYTCCKTARYPGR